MDGRVNYHNTFKPSPQKRNLPDVKGAKKGGRISPLDSGSPKNLSGSKSNMTARKLDQVTFTIGATNLKTASQFRNFNATMKQSTTDYNALSKSTYLSPHLQTKTKGFVSFDL